MTIWELGIALGVMYLALRPAIEAGFKPYWEEDDDDSI